VRSSSYLFTELELDKRLLTVNLARDQCKIIYFVKPILNLKEIVQTEIYGANLYDVISIKEKKTFSLATVLHSWAKSEARRPAA